MRFSNFWKAIIICGCFSVAACSRSGRPPATDTVPLTRVKGTVLVNGVPTAGVQIQYIPQNEIAERRERYINRFFTRSREGGKFSLSTYVDGDGVPYGDYVLEFKWIEQRLSGEVDRFGGKYSDSASPFGIVTVKKGPAIDLGEIQLTTAPRERKD